MKRVALALFATAALISGCSSDSGSPIAGGTSNEVIQVEQLANPGINEALLLSNASLNAYNSLTPAQVAGALQENPISNPVLLEAVGTLNVLEGVVSDAGTGRVRLNSGELTLKGKLNGSRTGDTLSLALRPEAIALGARPGNDSRLEGEIADVHFLGSVIRVRVGLGDAAISLDTFNNSSTPPPRVGDKAEISFSSGDVLVLH